VAIDAGGQKGNASENPKGENSNDRGRVTDILRKVVPIIRGAILNNILFI